MSWHVLLPLILSISGWCVSCDRIADDLGVGDGCRISGTGEPGRCTLFTQCPVIAAKARTHEHTLCGFRHLEPIVCCPLTEGADIDGGPDADALVDALIEDLFPATTRRPVARSVSAKMCLEYHRQVHENITIIRHPNGTTIESRQTQCPAVIYPTWIQDDSAPKLFDYPHTVLLGYAAGPRRSAMAQVQWRCGGSLISDRYVLTAAHCIAGPMGTPTRVKLGAHRVRIDVAAHTDASAVDVAVDATIAHPDYDRRSHYNDIGLVRLAERVPLSQHIRPICLPTAERDDSESSATATGWATDDKEKRQAMASMTGRPEVLLEVDVEQFTPAACTAALGQVAGTERLVRGVDRRTQLCAASYAEAKDTCRPDDGGPLQTYYSDSYKPCLRKLIGVTSFGKTCGTPDSPGVYTRVYPYLAWIEAILWPKVLPL